MTTTILKASRSGRVALFAVWTVMMSSVIWNTGVPVSAQEASQAQVIPSADDSDLSLKLEIQNAIRKGARWLLTHQEQEGHWSDPDHPALTSFALFALMNDPVRTAKGDQYSPVISNGYAYLQRKVRPDGGIYTDGVGLANYNTSVSIMALTAAGNPEYDTLIRNARSFVIKGQFDFDEKGELDHPLDGGIGYGNSYPHSDLSNTVLALEALRFSEAWKPENPALGEEELNWEAAIKFISNCQNLKGANTQSWVSEDPANKGGFVYFPGNTKSETVELPDGRVALRSYGSISYAGLLSFAYARLDPTDQRVAAVKQWLSENYTLEENPGMDQQGLFYYYHTMAKALTAARVQSLTTVDSRTVNWRKDLALKLLDLQNLNGSWSNETARWWEKDPVLVTSYCLIALELIEQAL